MLRAARSGLLALMLLAAFGLMAPALANPFQGRTAPLGEAAGEPEEAQRAGGPLAMFGRALLTFQREANRLIAQHMRAIREGETSVPLLIGVALAFAYGVVHALGPGHGKLVVASYFLTREAQVGRGLLMGVQIAICHVLSAVVAVALADILLRQAFGSTATETGGVRLASYGLIGMIGIVMLTQAAAPGYAVRASRSATHAAITGARRAITATVRSGRGRSRVRCPSASAWYRAPVRC